jgi:hypothetical protein
MASLPVDIPANRASKKCVMRLPGLFGYNVLHLFFRNRYNRFIAVQASAKNSFGIYFKLEFFDNEGKLFATVIWFNKKVLRWIMLVNVAGITGQQNLVRDVQLQSIV